MRRHLIHVGLCLATSLAAVAHAAEEPAAAPKATLAGLAWMAGHWIDDAGGDLSEEIWTAAAGDSMMGVWRLVQGGKAKVYELVTIQAEQDGLVYRLRHFDRMGVAWEDKDHPLVMKLVRFKDGEAAFEGPGSAGFLRLSYRRDGASGLAVVLEKGTSEAAASKSEFRFRRRSAADK